MTTQENRRSRITRRVFRESLTELMLEKGMQKISVNEICKRADMNRSTFYAHYEDQFDLLREIEDEFLITLRKTVTESNLQNFTQKFEKYLGYLYQNGSLYTLLMREAPDFRDPLRIDQDGGWVDLLKDPFLQPGGVQQICQDPLIRDCQDGGRIDHGRL